MTDTELFREEMQDLLTNAERLIEARESLQEYYEETGAHMEPSEIYPALGSLSMPGARMSLQDLLDGLKAHVHGELAHLDDNVHGTELETEVMDKGRELLKRV